MVSAFVAARPKAVGARPDSPAGGHVESKKIAEADPTGAETWQPYIRRLVKLHLWKLLKSRQIGVLANHSYFFC
jgi:hypothetical protein